MAAPAEAATAPLPASFPWPVPGEGPKIAPRLTLGAGDITATVDRVIEHSEKALDAIAAVKPEEATFETVLLPMLNLDNDIGAAVTSTTFPKSVATASEVRDAANDARDKLSQFHVKSEMRIDVYKVVEAFSKTPAAAALTGEEKRFLEHRLRDYRRKGLHLPEDKRAEVEELLKKQASLSNEFSKNIAADKTTLELSAEDLAGMPADFIASLDKVAPKDEAKEEGTTYKVTMAYPHMIPISKFCSVEATRKAMFTAFNRRAIDKNEAILHELVALRRQTAKLLGYDTHADFQLETRMAKSAKSVRDFLEKLAKDFSPLAEAEMKRLTALKAADVGDADATLQKWDVRYYQNKELEAEYKIDLNAMRQYFPLEVVTEGMLKAYQMVLGLTFKELPAGELAWHEDVKLYEVNDASDGALVGYFFLDLHPREGKFSHAAAFPLQYSCELDDGTRMYPTASIVANFTKGTADSPSLLTHDEVVTFFHEFGHIMHHVCSMTKYREFSGFSVETDFVEAPSQMLENWCWEEAPLQLLSKHIETGESLPADMIAKRVASKNAHAGMFNIRQIVLATFDQIIHTAEGPVDSAAILNELNKTMLGLPPVEGTNMAAAFGHLGGGYDAQYYSYLWSEVFAADMFETRFKAEGLLEPKVGKAYRDLILRPGGSKDASELLRDFLGRDPITEPFLRSKGLTEAKL